VKTATFSFLISVGLLSIPSFAQYEDLSGVTGGASKAAQFCALKAIKVTHKDGVNGAKDVSIAFQFTGGKPSVFFNYYDASKKAVVFDFYDAHRSKDAVDTVKEAPITHSSMDSVQIDLNKDAKGIEPDIRDVVRVTLFTQYDLAYETQENGGLITMNFKWSPAIQAGFTRKKKALYWQVPLATVVAGGAGFAAYEMFLKKEPAKDDNPLNTLPSRPSQ
jgi:hypothetical protein